MNVVIMLICVVVIFVIVFCVKKHNKAKAKARALEEKWFMNAKMEQIKAVSNKIQKEILENGLPILDVQTLKLSKDEVCHFKGEAFLCKIKKETVGYEGGSRGVSVRVIKGVSFRMGNYKGEYVKEDCVNSTEGMIYLTNKKLVFTAVVNSCVIKYEDIINLNLIEDMLQIQTEIKTYLFRAINNLVFLNTFEYIINERKK